jgi:hypothetical protein
MFCSVQRLPRILAHPFESLDHVHATELVYAPKNKLIVQCILRSNFRRPHESLGENLIFTIELNFDALFAIVMHSSIITVLNVT